MKSKKSRQIVLFFTLYVTIGSLALFSLCMDIATFKISYNLGKLKKEMEHLSKENKKMEFQIWTLTSPDQIYLRATTELGMERPVKIDYIKIP